MKLKNLLIPLLILISFGLQAQNQQKAEKVVAKFLKKQHSDYKPEMFDELFDQTYDEFMAQKLEVWKEIKYSLSHTYYVGDSLVKMHYFHFDEKYELVGDNSAQEMAELAVEEMFMALEAALEEIEQESSLPTANGYVNDFEEILTKEEEEKLASIISKHEFETTNQIAIVTIKSYEPYETLFDYSLALANHWGVGTKEKNNGILIAFSKNKREVRIQNGYGIEEILTNEETKKIIDEIMIPEFKQDQYFEGLLKGLDAIIKELNQ